MSSTILIVVNIGGGYYYVIDSNVIDLHNIQYSDDMYHRYYPNICIVNDKGLMNRKERKNPHQIINVSIEMPK
jgi:hypothetical protein